MMANIFCAAPATLIYEEEECIRRGPWTVEEDMTLIRCISARGEGRWNTIAKYAGLRRTGKSCRLRWLNYLRPDVKRGNITPEEQFLILDLHQRWGNRWSKIARHLPGRTDNEIKNFWRTRVKKLIQKAKCSGDMRLQLQDYSHSHYNSCSWISKSSSIDTSNTNQCPMSSTENRSVGANGLDIQVDGRESVGFTPTGLQRFAIFHSDQGSFCSTNYPQQKDVAALASFGREQNQWTGQGEACGLGCGCSYDRCPRPLGDILDNHETPLCSTGVRTLPINDVNVVFNPVITSQSEFFKGSASGLGSGVGGSIDSSEVEASSSNDAGIFDIEIGWPYETNSLWNNEEMWYAPEA